MSKNNLSMSKNSLSRMIIAIKWISFFLATVLELALAISFFIFKEDRNKAILSLIVIYVLSIALIFALNNSIFVLVKKHVAIRRKGHMRMFQSVSILFDIVLEFFRSLNLVGGVVSADNNDYGEYSYLKDDIKQFIQIRQKHFEESSESSEKKFEIGQIFRMFDDLDKANEILQKVIPSVNEEIHIFNSKMKYVETIRGKATNNLANILYQFRTSSEILSSISTESMDYSVKMIKEIFEEFEKISEESEESAQDTEKIMRSFIDSTNDDSLLYILNETKTFISRFDDFNAIINDLKTISDTFMNKTLASLKEIQNIANSINEISEKIKIISINVRIEAARLDSKTSGFKTLGNEISEFAGLTSKIISRANTEVSDTLTHINSVKDDYVNKMNEVINYIPEFQKSLSPFESILNGSFNKIRLIISELYKTSSDINASIKKIIDKFQYQDITLQETQNIISYINRLSDEFVDISANLNIDLQITENEKREIDKKIYNTFNKIITTQKEREVIVEFAKKHNVFEDKNVEAAKELKEVDKNIIMF
ncbi:MAG TPA: methyl-accepting chemotaxis protein [Spirochaetota bacterium]|jgi:methyl-accepting chemotaxis protein|nr:MAG: Methyl-accepting chemotaxis protein (MCP) signaling domain protein [Spirochaetes bacterium ADurb.Bin133]HNZ27907.1 methyl-accepting chemotaxis protein [Spirochaetota bacterium]HPY86728.1 methyl-accepting chemotaxis protein [Spirochaetota bacterium]HQB60030.1 methyl-accepting chemotaxis protein [Spirochaetota bacterium]